MTAERLSNKHVQLWGHAVQGWEVASRLVRVQCSEYLEQVLGVPGQEVWVLGLGLQDVLLQHVAALGAERGLA